MFGSVGCCLLSFFSADSDKSLRILALGPNQKTKINLLNRIQNDYTPPIADGGFFILKSAYKDTLRLRCRLRHDVIIRSLIDSMILSSKILY